MTHDKDILANRLTRICNAKPAISTPPPPPRQSRSRYRPQREAVFRLASVYTGKNTFVRCVVNEVSENGARFTLKAPQAFPETVIVKFDQNGARKRVRVVWQDDYETGVEYSDDQTRIDGICPPGAPVKAAH